VIIAETIRALKAPIPGTSAIARRATMSDDIVRAAIRQVELHGMKRELLLELVRNYYQERIRAGDKDIGYYSIEPMLCRMIRAIDREFYPRCKAASGIWQEGIPAICDRCGGEFCDRHQGSKPAINGMYQGDCGIGPTPEIPCGICGSCIEGKVSLCPTT